jgi:hypothetical protein
VRLYGPTWCRAAVGLRPTNGRFQIQFPVLRWFDGVGLSHSINIREMTVLALHDDFDREECSSGVEGTPAVRAD